MLRHSAVEVSMPVDPVLVGLEVLVGCVWLADVEVGNVPSEADRVRHFSLRGYDVGHGVARCHAAPRDPGQPAGRFPRIVGMTTKADETLGIGVSIHDAERLWAVDPGVDDR